MSGFNYFGLSTKDILDEPLILVNIGSNDITSVVGSNRNLQSSEITITRNYRNEYGTITDLLSFNYGLIKNNGESFTVEEQIKIEQWLNASQKSSLLEVYDCNEVVRYKYIGLFTNTTWQLPSTDDTFQICQFTFSVNGSYPIEHYVEMLNNAGTNTVWEFNVPLSIVQENVYPTLEITPHNSEYLPTNFQIVNVTDNSNKMVFTIEQCTGLNVDCKKCMISNLDDTSQSPSLSFKNFGWEDVGNIYWIRLSQGQNQLLVKGEGAIDIKLSYDLPVRKAGGWLI